MQINGKINKLFSGLGASKTQNRLTEREKKQTLEIQTLFNLLDMISNNYFSKLKVDSLSLNISTVYVLTTKIKLSLFWRPV